ncbi:MAG: hypothetical protein ACLQPD_27210 [Desulfomonilaceae bacterium]
MPTASESAYKDITESDGTVVGSSADDFNGYAPALRCPPLVLNRMISEVNLGRHDLEVNKAGHGVD